MRVLLVEDDHMIGSVVQQELRDAGYAVDWVRDGAAALSSMEALSYSMLLLDLGLSRADGMAVLRAMRAARSDVPLLVLTARDATGNCVEGPDSGADDYLAKPFSLSELLVRMRALTLHQERAAAPSLSNGIVTLKPATREAQVGAGSMRLTASEYGLLQSLLLRPGAILSRSELEHRVYGRDEEAEGNAIELLIHSLRKKLGSDIIKNVRGVGWMVSKAL